MFYLTSSDLTNLSFLNFLLYIRVHLINNVGQFQVYNSDSVIHIHVFVLYYSFQILFPVRSLQDINQSSMCYIVGPCWLSILNTEVCTGQSQTP